MLDCECEGVSLMVVRAASARMAREGEGMLHFVGEGMLERMC